MSSSSAAAAAAAAATINSNSNSNSNRNSNSNSNSNINSSSTSASNKPSSRKRRLSYTRVACEECQRRKTKCTGEQPCKVCRNSNNACVYKRTTRFRSGDRGSNLYWDSSRHVSSSQNDSPFSMAQKTASHVSAPQQPASSYHRTSYPLTGSVALSSLPTMSGSDYYLRLAEQCLISPESQNQDVKSAKPSPPVAGTLILQQLISHRESEHPGSSALALLDSRRWQKITKAYEEEIGVMYPFLNVNRLRQDIQTISRMGPRSVHLPTRPPPAESDRPDPEQLEERLEDVAMLLLAIVSFLIDSDVPRVADSWVEKTYANVLTQTQLQSAVALNDVSALILACVYFFLTDRETLSWRGIGIALRLLMEQDSQSPSGSNLEAQHWDPVQADKMFWAAFTLDRRWSFGTGLPFSVPDSEIRGSPSFTDDTPSLSYLKHMISYCRIASDVRKWLTESTMFPGSSFEFNRDLLTFRVEQWQRNLPSCLHFEGLEDVFIPEKENRGHYRVRLTLYLRANQMIIIVHRKMMVGGGSSNGFESSTANTLASIARDSIRILVRLARDTDIYYTQYRTFNHFLETALSSLLLALGSIREEEDREIYLKDGYEALDLMERLSTKFSRAKRLFERFDGVREIMNQFRERNRKLSQAARSHRGSTTAEKGGQFSSGQAARGSLVGSSSSNQFSPKLSGQDYGGGQAGSGDIKPSLSERRHSAAPIKPMLRSDQGKQEDQPEPSNYAAYPQSDDMCPSLTPDTYASTGTFSQIYQASAAADAAPAAAPANPGQDFGLPGGLGSAASDFDAAAYFPDFSLVFKPHEMEFIL